jgi:enamine deaminase RidA (YjgF/YER057c/UK114 family)
MTKLIENRNGNYSFLPGGSPYSAGVTASPGYELIHTTFREPVPLYEALDAIGTHLSRDGRPLAALCALELRSPAPASFSGFADFNEEYRALLRKYDLLPDGPNPIARTNVSPSLGTPSQPVVHAFTYSVPVVQNGRGLTFIVSGAGELEDSTLNPSAIRRAGEQSDEAIAEKAALVMEIMETRLEALQAGWSRVTSVDIYTVHNIYPFFEKVILSRAGDAARYGVRWYQSRPPVTGIEFEMDLHGVHQERYL